MVVLVDDPLGPEFLGKLIPHCSVEVVRKPVGAQELRGDANDEDAD
jgi:hypothetical protein